uniref:Helicase, putative n=1 Tax=Arundo donax TaxID=35708 RepID=A0A0A9C719_ARUDO
MTRLRRLRWRRRSLKVHGRVIGCASLSAVVQRRLLLRDSARDWSWVN